MHILSLTDCFRSSAGMILDIDIQNKVWACEFSWFTGPVGLWSEKFFIKTALTLYERRMNPIKTYNFRTKLDYLRGRRGRDRMVVGRYDFRYRHIF
jgi:hypothetical protein